MLYIPGVNQPALSTGRQPVTSRGKGNLVKENAGLVPGSTRSRHTALARSFPFVLPSASVPARVENAYKMRPKCIQKRTCDFFNYSASITYNFDPKKWSHFPTPLTLNPNPNLNHPWMRFQRALCPSTYRFIHTSHYFPLLSLPPSQCPVPLWWTRGNKPFNILYKIGGSPIFYRFDHAVPATYANQNRRTPIFWRAELRDAFAGGTLSFLPGGEGQNFSKPGLVGMTTGMFFDN